MNSTAVLKSAWSAAIRSSTSASTVASRPGRRLVEDQQRRVLGERHRDHDALLHAAGELVRVARRAPARGRRSARARARRARARAPRRARTPRDAEDLGDLRADLDRRVQRVGRVLVDHRRAARRAAGAAARVESASTSLPATRIEPAADAAVARQVAHDRERGRRLAAAGLADEAVGLAGADRERDAAQHLALGARAPGRRRRGPRARAPGAEPARSSLEHLRDAVGDQVDRDHERRDRERREQHRPPVACRPRAACSCRRSAAPSRATAAARRSRGS